MPLGYKHIAPLGLNAARGLSIMENRPTRFWSDKRSRRPGDLLTYHALRITFHMSPLWGLEEGGMPPGYKHVAPLGLKTSCPLASSLPRFLAPSLPRFPRMPPRWG